MYVCIKGRGGKIYPKGTTDTTWIIPNTTSFRDNGNAILNEMGQAPKAGTLKMSLPKTPASVPRFIYARLRLEGLQQNLYDIEKFHAILSYPASNQRANLGWAQRKILNIQVTRWPENAILGVFMVSKVKKEYPNVFSQKSNSCPLAPVGGGQGRRSMLHPCCKRPFCYQLP